ncbi:hypothetical protein ES703_73454 [subsurface metagenome]
MPLLFEETDILFKKERTRRLENNNEDELPWYKESYGKYPYSADILDILRAVPAGILGGVTGVALVEDPNTAALAGATIGGASNALLRAQLATEYMAYDLAVPGKPIYHTTKEFKEHQIFVGAIEALIGVGIGGAIGYLGAKARKQ